MSKRLSPSLVLILILLLAAACGPNATATPTRVPEATQAVQAATQEATAEVTEAATKEATAEATAEATKEVTAEVTEAATKEATAEATEAIAAVTAEATAEPTKKPTVQPTKVATKEATAEVTAEATKEVAAAPTATVKPTLEPTAVPAETTAEATAEATAPSTGGLIKVRLQLQWYVQSQFAGYFAAVDQGFYKDEGLDVTILEGAADIVPQQVVASDGAEFGIAWVPKVLASREQGADLVNIAQVFQRSGTLEISFKDKGIESVDDLKGKRVGTWGFGNEHELFAALRAQNIDPTNKSDVDIETQDFTMSQMLTDQLDAAEAMTYNEYAQVLEATDDSGKLKYTPDDLNVINFNDVGTAMLQDHLFARESWLAKPGNEDVAVKFIRASLKGWIYCRDNFDACVDLVLKHGPTLGKGHMTWQLNEINKLIWPSPDGIGIMDKALWDQTVKVALDGKVITAQPTDGAYRTDLAQKAVDSLKADGEDVTGSNYKPQTVEITPGGQ
jgi:NitT/TauT family transport system substrate-binding protein